MVARTLLASIPVALYAGLFVCVDIAYNVFEYQVMAQADAAQVTARMGVSRGAGHWWCWWALRPLCWWHWPHRGWASP